MKKEIKTKMIHALVLVGLSAHVAGVVIDLEILSILGILMFIIGIVLMHFRNKKKKS